MIYTDKDIELLEQISFVAIHYDLIENEYALKKLTEFIASLIGHEPSASSHGAEVAYSCLVVVYFLMEGEIPNKKIKFTDKRKLEPLKGQMSDLADRMNNFYHFDV